MLNELQKSSQRFVVQILSELEFARGKFPSSDGVMTALTEEVGEVAKALMNEPMRNVYEEAVQVATIACRIATEGDPTLAAIREERGADK